ncbi:RluA family pseudouridine synthase [Acetobacter oeni]|uniref:RNA pseudouridine synthase n=1 Tax=Acetobacter oeni TaxID=304077 RepID=A0A511XGM9_9PROT|nr:RNA pseudouridine synthase [Acetobacter oeni]MBB3881741.1 tRNA pseudouridine32 synthase/23S rRNA pseudouridine746 synthase [Acetobacter oeni]NHO17457.1 RNA pseudouridine synthase [Acetobacter oeni]GBR01897.1 ribosomal RNA large subunit 23S rRNA pseudouridine synthase A [Acetobacter oeni LMG 21952]GEN62088.1 RNA pseudouridine synthase [Acetobacter oeni]
MRKHRKVTKTVPGNAPPSPAPAPVLPLPFDILFQNNQVVIINKPFGLAVHTGPRKGPSVEDWFPQLSRRKDGPWLAHRLDADTSGCLAIALRKQALISMQDCFASGAVKKIYWVVVRGVAPEHGVIDRPVMRVSGPDGWKMIVSPDGQQARTSWRRLGTDGNVSWLELTLHTGRTHQARIHCAELGMPVIGDTVYGTENTRQRLHLLSRELDIPLTVPVSAVAPPPEHMRNALMRCGCVPDQAPVIPS